MEKEKLLIAGSHLSVTQRQGMVPAGENAPTARSSAKPSTPTDSTRPGEPSALANRVNQAQIIARRWQWRTTTALRCGLAFSDNGKLNGEMLELHVLRTKL